jgi:hypothetical protein
MKIKNKTYKGSTDLYEIVLMSGEAINGGIQISSTMIEGNFSSKRDVVYNSTLNKIQLKNDESKKYDKYKIIQKEMLNNVQLKELRNAMTFQKMAELTGSDPANKIFTDQQIIDWGNYFGEIAKDNHDLSGLTIEQIDASVFGAMPSIPEAYEDILE